MSSGLQSLIDSGTKLWLDSIDPDLVTLNLKQGATGATSNPVIVSGLIKTGRFDDRLIELASSGLGVDEIAWAITDDLVGRAQKEFQHVWQATSGDNGYVSFELDPLLEDKAAAMPDEERTRRYIELGRKWSSNQPNRMIKVPATPAGIASLESLAAEGVSLNVTLIFSQRQYEAARDAIWRGAQQRKSLGEFKSVYSVFISRIDVYTEKHAADLSDEAQGQVGILNAKRMWQSNQEYWQDRSTPLSQEIVFASTGTKRPEDPPWKYVVALAGSDIQTNPPETNQAVAESGMSFVRTVDQPLSDSVQDEIDDKVDFEKLEEVLLDEGIDKFEKPQQDLLRLIEDKIANLASR